MNPRNARPVARSQDLMTQELDDELLVYDRVSHEAHSLDKRAAALWRACDGVNTVDDLEKAVGASHAEVIEALVVLGQRGLLETPFEPSSGTSRRAMLRGGLVAGGAMAIGAPVIRSVLVPEPAGAQSPGPCTASGDPCGSDPECCSGSCFDYGGGGLCA